MSVGTLPFTSHISPVMKLINIPLKIPVVPWPEIWNTCPGDEKVEGYSFYKYQKEVLKTSVLTPYSGTLKWSTNVSLKNSSCPTLQHFPGYCNILWTLQGCFHMAKRTQYVQDILKILCGNFPY